MKVEKGTIIGHIQTNEVGNSGEHNVLEGMEELPRDNIAIGRDALCNATIANHCICLGLKAGDNIVSEPYQFRYVTTGTEPIEFGCIMTPDEFEVVHRIILRAVNSIPRKIVE